MCGIAGLIGKSKKPEVTFELMSNLFDWLEIRGTDASGFWGVNEKNSVIYHKEPIKSGEFIKLPLWRRVKTFNPDLLLLHARAASFGVGYAGKNKNNHPFVNSNRTIAMVHNGRIEEADDLSKKYEVLSDTDSEVLLRMYEGGLRKVPEVYEGIPEDVALRLNGVRDIWGATADDNISAMAVAVGEFSHEGRYLLLFRNNKRPLWYIDLRDRLGQVVFFSSTDIWHRAVANTSQTLRKIIAGREELVEVPPDEVWVIRTNSSESVPKDESIYRFEVEIAAEGEELNVEDKVYIPPKSKEFPLITGLDDQDVVIGGTSKAASAPQKTYPTYNTAQPLNPTYGSTPPYTSAAKHSSSKVFGGGSPPADEDTVLEIDDDDIKISTETFAENCTEHIKVCDSIKEVLDDLKWKVTHYLSSGSISSKDYDELIEALRGTELDLYGTLRILGG